MKRPVEICAAAAAIAHRLERGDACIGSSTKGARYCQNEVAFLRSPRGGRPRRKVRRARARRALRPVSLEEKTLVRNLADPAESFPSIEAADLNPLMERIRNRIREPGPICRSNSTNTS